NPKRRDPPSGQPFIARSITCRPAPTRMRLAIELDRQPSVGAEKIEHIAACRVLPPEFEAVGACAQHSPQHGLGQAHLAAQATGIADGARTPLRRDVLEHRPTPPPCFAWSPSPRQARGGSSAKEPCP